MLEKEINGVVCLKKFVKMYDIWTIGREDGLVLPAARTGLVNHLKNTESGIKIQLRYNRKYLCCSACVHAPEHQILKKISLNNL